MAAVQPGPGNVFVYNHDASNKLVVDFSRNVSAFPVNKYTQIAKTNKTAGLYMEMTVEEAGRVLYSDGRDSLWYDGHPDLENNGETESFQWKTFETLRRREGFNLGDLTVDQATWDIVAQHASIKTRKLMTLRTQLAVTALTTTGNYAASHVLDVTAITGNLGTWAQSTTARQDIRRSINTAIEVIRDDTLDVVGPSDLVLVINSALARQMAESQEIVDYIKGSPDALDMIRGNKSRNAAYGLPDTLYGVDLVVESTRKVTSKKGATRAVSQVLATATPFLAARPGALEAPATGPNFCTCVGFFQEEMTVETKRDTDHRRTRGRVVENYVYKMVAPASGVMFQNAA